MCDLSYIVPVVSSRAVVLVKPLVKQMMLVRCFGIIKPVIALAVPEIFPNGGFKTFTVGGFGSGCCKAELSASAVQNNAVIIFFMMITLLYISGIVLKIEF